VFGARGGSRVGRVDGGTRVEEVAGIAGQGQIDSMKGWQGREIWRIRWCGLEF
jgi:hypothetical protein